MSTPGRSLSLILVTVCGLVIAAGPESASDAPDPHWRQGPVRYILLSTEDQEYRSLKSDDARRVETIEAPDFSEHLALSSIVVGRLPDGKAAALTPDPRATFHPGEALAFAYQVYNARLKEGAPDLDVEYRFFAELPDGPRPAGAPVVLPHQTSLTLAYSLPLQGWPAAAYRVRVQVTDKRRSATATREVTFRIVVP